MVLFAALAYAVTSSMRGGGKSASTEKLDLMAAQILNAGALLENAMQREMLMNNVPEYGFDLSGANSSSSSNATCAAQNCRLLAGNGGQIALPAIPASLLMTTNVDFYAKAHFWVAKIVDVGTDKPDVVMAYRFLTKELCEALQRATQTTDVSLSTSDGRGGDTGYDYSGTMTALPENTTWAYGDAMDSLRGKRATCLRNDINPQYVFYYVLLAR